MNHNNGNKATFRPILEGSKTPASFSYSSKNFLQTLIVWDKKIAGHYQKAFMTRSFNIYIYIY